MTELEKALYYERRAMNARSLYEQVYNDAYNNWHHMDQIKSVKERLRQAELEWEKYAAELRPIPLPKHPNIAINDNIWFASPYEGRFVLRTDTEDTRKALHSVYSNAYSGDMKAIKEQISFGSYYSLFKIMGDVVYRNRQMSLANMTAGSIFGNPNETTLRMVISIFNSWLLFYIEKNRAERSFLCKLLYDISKSTIDDIYKQYEIYDYSFTV